MIGIEAGSGHCAGHSAGLRRCALLPRSVALLVAATLFAAEVIQSFDSEVRVAKDGELTVTETLRVQAEGRDIRHGIYRDFPLTFKDAGGVLREVDFKLLGVERDGKAESYSTTRQHGIIRIYAGNKDTNVSRGEHTYVFRYRTGRQIRWFDGKPELNWNVTGNFWNFPILAATYRLQFVAGGAPVRWTAFTGRVGARGTDWRGSLGALGTLTVETTRRLAPGEGLTVVAEIPADAVDPPNANTAAVVRDFRQPAVDFRRHRSCVGARLLPRRVGGGRPRSQGRHHHSAVSIRRKEFRRRSPTTSTTGASAARNGVRSRRRRFRSPCAACCNFDDRGDSLTLKTDRQGSARRFRQAAGRRGRDHDLGEETRAAWPSSAAPTATRSPRSAIHSPRASKRKTAIASSGAISVMSLPGWP